MSITFGDAVLRIKSDDTALDKGLRESETKTKRWGNALGGALKGAIGVAIVGATGLVTSKAVGFITGAINAASDLGETVNKVNVILEGASDQVLDYAEGSARSMGLSKQAFLDAASTFGIYGKAAGLADSDLADFSTTLGSLVPDLASFHNANPDEVIVALGAALRGESEPMRRFGVLLDDMTLRQKAFELGITTTTKEALTPQQKVLASYAVIMEQTADAQGDFARTSGGLANQQRISKALWEDIGVSIGKFFLPLAEKAQKFINDKLLTTISTLVSYFQLVVEGGEPLNDFLSELPLWMQPVVEAIGTFIQALQEGNGPIESFLIALEGLIPPWLHSLITSIYDGLVRFSEVVSTFISEHGPLLKEILEAVGVALGSFVIINTIIGWVSRFISFVSLLGTVFTASGGIITTIVGILGGPLTIILGVVAAAIGLLYLAWKNNWGGIREKLAEVWAWLEPILQRLWAWLQEKVPQAIQTLKDFWDNTLLPAIRRVWEWVQANLFPMFQTAWEWLQEKVPEAIQTLSDFWTNTLLPAITAVYDFWKDPVQPFFESVADFLGAVFGKAIEEFSELWEETLKPALEEVWKFLQDHILPIFTEVRDFIEQNVGPVIKTFTTEVIDKLTSGLNWLKDALQKATDWFGRMADAIRGVPEPPSEYVADSPPPLGLGLQYINKELQKLTSNLPSLRLQMEMPQGGLLTAALSGGSEGRVNGEQHIHHHWEFNPRYSEFQSEGSLFSDVQRLMLMLPEV